MNKMENNNNEIVVDVENLKKYFPIKDGILQRTVGHVRAVDGVSLQIKRTDLWSCWRVRMW